SRPAGTRRTVTGYTLITPGPENGVRSLCRMRKARRIDGVEQPHQIGLAAWKSNGSVAQIQGLGKRDKHCGRQPGSPSLSCNRCDTANDAVRQYTKHRGKHATNRIAPSQVATARHAVLSGAFRGVIAR